MYNRSLSYWQKDYYFPSLDVAIVGGGFTGLIAGIELLSRKPKVKVGLFEQQTHGTLASSRNAGFMCFGSPTELNADIIQFGEAEVLRVLALKATGYHTLLKHLAGNKRIYKKCPAYELFKVPSSDYGPMVESLPKLNALLSKGTGIESYYESHALSPSSHLQSIRFKKEGQLHPTAAVAALQRKFMNLGGIYHAGTTIAHWEAISGGYLLNTQNDEQVNCNKMIVANNAFATTLVSDYFVQPQRAQVLVTAPLKKLPYRGNFHMDGGYVYFRNIGNRLLLGGLRNTDFETEATDEIGLNANIQRKLDSLLIELLPNQSVEITHRWSGIMGFRKGTLPQLEVHSSGIVIAAGMNGMGTLLGPALGRKAALHVLNA